VFSVSEVRFRGRLVPLGAESESRSPVMAGLARIRPSSLSRFGSCTESVLATAVGTAKAHRTSSRARSRTAVITLVAVCWATVCSIRAKSTSKLEGYTFGGDDDLVDDLVSDLLGPGSSIRRKLSKFFFPPIRGRPPVALPVVEISLFERVCGVTVCSWAGSSSTSSVRLLGDSNSSPSADPSVPWERRGERLLPLSATLEPPLSAVLGPPLSAALGLFLATVLWAMT
jgi:hypothetical protein